MAKSHAHYYSRNNGKDTRRKKKDMIPGQLCLDLDQDLLVIVEEKPLNEPAKPERICTVEASKEYWTAFKEFLDASGVFARTWNLYKQVKKDPSIQELDEQLNGDLSPEQRARIEEIKEGVVRRDTAMRQKMFCENPEEVFVKAHNDWNRFKGKFNRLISKAVQANVPFALSTEQKREWMLNFVLLDDTHQGSKRRNFYKDKFVERALKSIDKTGYSDPVSLIDIEAAYKTWREKNSKRRQC